MGLLDSLRIGTSGLAAHQAAIQITGNNIANAATPGYARQVPELSAVGESRFGRMRAGAGVELTAVRRMVDQAIQSRLQTANGQVQQHTVATQTLSRIESLMNEMTDTDLSSALTNLFNSFSALAGSAQDESLRGVVLQRAGAVVDQFHYLREGLEQIRLDIGSQLAGAVQDADRLAGAIADINAKVVAAEGGGATAASLRDQRDQLLGQLSQYIDITTREEENGAVNVFIGSEPLVYHASSRGLKLAVQDVNGQATEVVAFSDDGGGIKLLGGTITGLQATRDGDLHEVIARLDKLAGELIWQVNRIHASGSGLDGLREVTGTCQVTDPIAAMDGDGFTVPFAPSNGSFMLSVTNSITGAVSTRQIDVHLDAAGGHMSLNDLLAAINAGGDVQASVDARGFVTIRAVDGNDRISFSQDSSGVLAALGINTFFSGSSANDIAVNADVAADARRIAAGVPAGGNIQPGDGANAAVLAQLADRKLGTLGNTSLLQYQQSIVSNVAVWASTAQQNATSAQVVQDSLTAQRESVSGVSLDEEAVNLIRYQRAFQGSARFITVVNELLDTLFSTAS